MWAVETGVTTCYISVRNKLAGSIVLMDPCVSFMVLCLIETASGLHLFDIVLRLSIQFVVSHLKTSSFPFKRNKVRSVVVFDY